MIIKTTYTNVSMLSWAGTLTRPTSTLRYIQNW